MVSKQNEKIVLDYLVQQNRPFSAQDLANNLGGQIGKSAIVKILDDLAASKRINEKVYNKSKVYMALQNVDSSIFRTQLRNLDEKVVLLNGDLNRLKMDNSRLESQLRGHKSKISMSELRQRIAIEAEELGQLSERLESLKSSNVKVLSKEEKSKIQKEHEKYAREWRKLKRITKEMMDTIMENCNMKKAQLCEDLGIVLDEHENVEPPKI